MQRIGVFVCHCGTNIAGTVDVKAVAQALKNEPGVVFSTDYQYMCSQAGQDIIKAAIAEHQLSGIVVCSCSPAAGLNPYMVEIANIREQCSWVHKEMPVGTEKAIILGKAAVAKVNLNAPLTPGESPVTKRALVIGGGIAGYCRRRLPGGYRGDQAHHRRQDGSARQNLPNAGLRGLHLNAQDGGCGAE